MNCFFHSSPWLFFLPSFFCSLTPLCPLFFIFRIPAIPHSCLPVLSSSFLFFFFCDSCGELHLPRPPSSVRSFIPPSPVLIYSPSTRPASVSSELPGIIYCLMVYSSSHQPSSALLYLLIFISFVLVCACVCVSERAGEAHTKRHKAQGHPARWSR